MPNSTQWFRVLDLDELPEGRVKTVVAGHKSLAMTHYQGQYGALDNRCPHQGGPLGEGSIENGYLRCPWHGWDYCPHTGRPPGDLAVEDALETFAVETRDDGIYVGLPVEPEHTRTVSDVMSETLVNWGITHVFGMVGHSNLGLADALRRQEVAGNLTFIGIRHEGAGAFAASAYAKLTGRPAACLTIAGPGATNLLTGMWDAKVDRAPILALTGQVNSQVLGTGNFQECDLSAAFNGVAAWQGTVLNNSKHAELASLAVKHALLERNVSHLIFPDEIQNQPAIDVPAATPEGRLTPLQIAPPPESLEKAIALLKPAKRPVIIVGHGARFNMTAITQLAEQLGAPVLTTFKGKGLISDQHPLGCGVLGRSGTPIASWFMNEADVLLVLGASFSNHTGIYPGKPIIQVDFDPLALGKFHPVEVPVWGEISIVVEQLKTVLTGQTNTEDQQSQISERWAIWRAEKQNREQDDRGNGVNSAAIFAAMTRHVAKNAVISVDVGNNTYSFGRYFECEAQSVLMSGYLGSIGFGFPGGMGAWAAAGHERQIVSLSGDGGFGQYLADFNTAVKYGMNITHILVNNSQLGKISKEQRAGEWDVWQTSLSNPNFAKYAENCGGFGVRVDQQADLDAAMTQALAYEGPALVEIIADPELI